MFNGRVVPKQQTQNHEIIVGECGVKNKLQRSQNNVNTIKIAIRVRAPRNRENLITIFYKLCGIPLLRQIEQIQGRWSILLYSRLPNCRGQMLTARILINILFFHPKTSYPTFPGVPDVWGGVR